MFWGGASTRCTTCDITSSCFTVQHVRWTRAAGIAGTRPLPQLLPGGPGLLPASQPRALRLPRGRSREHHHSRDTWDFRQAMLTPVTHIIHWKNALPAYSRSHKVFVGICYTTHPLGRTIRVAVSPETRKIYFAYSLDLFHIWRHILDVLRGILRFGFYV